MDCQLCEKPADVSLVSHHVRFHSYYCHPNYEIFPCRVPRDVADFLRNSNETHKVERRVQPRKICHKFKQCYYQHKYTEGDRRLAVSSPHHVCNGGVRNKVVKIQIPQFNQVDIYGYLCDLCNYVRFDESQMEKHLRSEHEGNVANKYKKVILFRFPKKKKKSEIESKIDDSFESSDRDMKQDIDTAAENKSRKWSKSVTNLNDDNEIPNRSTKKILRSCVIHSKPFIAAKEDDGIFDRDTMKLMKDVECSTRTNRTKSIAERFNSVQEDDKIVSQDEGQTVAESLDPLTRDEGIPIVIEIQTDDDYPMEENSVKEINQVTAKTTSSSTTTASVRENNSTPTEEFFDESDDNWESYSSDASEDDSEEDRVSISRPSNKKNVGIIDTIARLQQSISSQGATVQVDGVEKLAETTSESEDKVTVEEERNNETTRATTSGRQVHVVSKTPNDSTLNVVISDKSGGSDDKNNIDEENKPGEVLTYEAIVNEATQAEDGDAKTCVSNGRSSLGNYSFNLSTANKESQLGSRNGNLGASSSNADSNNDIEMDNPNCQTKVLTRIYNIGYTSSSSLGSCITFCCLIEQCEFESSNNDLYELLSHIEFHSVSWSGYCHACNAQVCNKDSIMMEFKHMIHEHLHKKDAKSSGKTADQTRMPLIKCKVLPGDKLSKSKEAEIDAKTKQLRIQDATPSSSAVCENNLIEIINAKSLKTKTTAIKAADTTSSPVTDSPYDQPTISKWKCVFCNDLCNDLCATQKQIQAQVQTFHEDPNKVKDIRGIHVCKSATKKNQIEVNKKTSKNKDKPVDADPPVVHTIHESESNSVDDNESNTILIVSDKDMKTAGTSTSNNSKVTSLNAVPSTTKNLIESGQRSLGSNSNTLTKASDELYACGHCFKFSNNSIALVKAHQTTAHPNVVCDVLIRNDLKGHPSSPDLIVCKPKEKPKFTDSINYICFHCIFKSQNPQIVYKHWKENHKFPKITTKNIEFPGRPFMFRILKIYQCFHCRFRTSFNDLKVHSFRKHPSKTFAMIDNMDPKKCGICSHKFDDYEKQIEEHFKEHINQGMSEPINYLTDEFLDQVIAVLPKDQVKCIHCNIIFFSVTELESHTKEKHTGIEMEYETLHKDPIMYGCFECPKTNSSETAMIEHIRKHLIQYRCKFCDNKFSQLGMLKQHHEIMHKVKDQTYRNIDVEQNLDKYLKMKIIFPNGLVLTKREAKYAKYGSTNEIIKLVTELNQKDLEAVQQRQQNEKHAEDVVSGVKKFSKVRKRVLVSSDNDYGSEPTSNVKPSTELRKRRKISDSNTDLASSIRSHLSIRENTSSVAPKMVTKECGAPNTEDKPLKNLIPYSFYGKQSKPLNLSKVFTHLQISGSNIRVSCDRFALLVNMSPKLRIKRCTDP